MVRTLMFLLLTALPLLIPFPIWIAIWPVMAAMTMDVVLRGNEKCNLCVYDAKGDA